MRPERKSVKGKEHHLWCESREQNTLPCYHCVISHFILCRSMSLRLKIKMSGFFLPASAFPFYHDVPSSMCVCLISFLFTSLSFFLRGFLEIATYLVSIIILLTLHLSETFSMLVWDSINTFRRCKSVCRYAYIPKEEKNVGCVSS